MLHAFGVLFVGRRCCLWITFLLYIKITCDFTKTTIMRSTIDESKKVKIPKRTRKIQFGDHIVRSEYNEGVRRDNNRASNRLSREMQYFEKAQKVILKDLGKETQMIRARMSSTYMSSPRLEALDTPTPRMTNPFAVYGTAAIPFVKIDSSLRLHKLKPLYPSPLLGEREIHDFSPRQRDINTFSPRQSVSSLKRKSLKTGTGNSAINKNEDNTKPSRGQSRNALKSGSTVVGTRFLSGNEPKANLASNNSEKKSAFQSEVDSALTEKLNENYSKVECVSSMSDARTASRIQSSRNSHVSFIDILRDVEERKAKQKQLEEKQISISEEQPQRPRTPKPMSNYDDQSNKNDNTELFKGKDRQQRVGATPSATYVNIPY